MLWFFWTLQVLLQRLCLTCHCVHTLTPRGNGERPESRIYLKIFEKAQYLVNTPKVTFLFKLYLESQGSSSLCTVHRMGPGNLLHHYHVETMSVFCTAIHFGDRNSSCPCQLHRSWSRQGRHRRKSDSSWLRPYWSRCSRSRQPSSWLLHSASCRVVLPWVRNPQ